MNKKINSTLSLILPSKKVNLFVIFIIILGIISGSIFLVVLNKNDKDLVINQLTTFMNNINSNNIHNVQAFKNCLIENIIFIVLTWILGLSIIGIIFNVFFIYLKGFVTGFTVSSFILAFKYKGLIASLIYIFPTSIINIIIALVIGSYSIILTKNLWKIIFFKDKTNSMSKFLKKYLLILCVCIVLALISSLTESYLVPALTKVVVKLFI